MNVSKDIYEYILLFVDDMTVINMLSVNKKYNNEEYFERFMRKKYPFLLIFKGNNSWKNLFIDMAHNIKYLKEKYDIPYIPTKGYNPKYLVIYTYKEPIYSCALYWAAEGGHMSIVEQMIEKGAKGFDVAMSWAAAGGDINVINFMIEKGARDFNNSLARAASAGHLKIVQYLIQKGATDISKAIERAKTKEIINYLESL